MRIYLRCNDIDKISYDVNNYQEKLTQNIYTVNGECNSFRSKMIFNNINLNNIFSQNEIKNKKTFNIKIISINNINENNKNIIDSLSPPQLRTSNIIMSGLNFLNKKNENIIGQFTNFNPNEEMYFENVFFHTGGIENYHHYYSKIQGNCGPFERLAFDNHTSVYTNPSTSLLKFKVTSNFITQLDEKIMRGSGLPIPGRSDLFIVRVEDAGSIYGVLQPKIIGQVNNFVNIQILPENNEWFNKQITDDIEQDNSNLEITAYMPSSSPIISLEFQLRDILTDVLQPVISEPNNKTFPSIQIVLDIY
jgi:hypothetical protein